VVIQLSPESISRVVIENLDRTEIAECSFAMMSKPDLIAVMMNESSRQGKVWNTEREVALWILNTVRQANRAGSA